jgi:hypothetical protein
MEIPVVIDDAPSADNQDAAVGSLRTTGMIARELGVEIHRCYSSSGHGRFRPH